MCLLGYCGYIGLFLYFPVHYILEENYPIVTRIIILIEQVEVFRFFYHHRNSSLQVRFLMKSHAFVRENAPRAILFGRIHSRESQF